jgi:hypothetical protein
VGRVQENKTLEVEKGRCLSEKDQESSPSTEEVTFSVEALRTAPANQKITTPEILLRVAVLSQAIKDLSRSGLDKEEARVWIMQEVISESGFSFAEICDVLGLDHELARQKILSEAKNRLEDK